MKRTLLLSAIALMALATVAGAQLMGNGQYWYSGDGGIPKFTPADVLDGNISDMKANGYHLWWGPSDVFSWGDTYGYSVDTNLESARLVVRAFDLDNNLYCAEGEDPAEVARRELIEEAGLIAGELVYLTEIYPSPGMTDSITSIYLATDCAPTDHDRHGPEEDFMEVLHVPLADAIEMVLDQRICDSKTVTGLLLTERRLRAADGA